MAIRFGGILTFFSVVLQLKIASVSSSSTYLNADDKTRFIGYLNAGSRVPNVGRFSDVLNLFYYVQPRDLNPITYFYIAFVKKKYTFV